MQVVKNWFFRDFSSKYDPKAEFLQFFLHHTIRIAKSLLVTEKKLSTHWHLAASSNFRKISIFWSFFVIWYQKNLTLAKISTRLTLYFNIEYIREKNSCLHCIFTKCHVSYDFKNLKKLQSEIWPLSDPLKIFSSSCRFFSLP